MPAANQKRTAAQIETALDEATFDPATRRRNAKGCLYGEFGSWKTSTAARTVVNKGLIVAVDDGWESLRNLKGNNGADTLLDNFTIMEYTGLSQLGAIADRVEDGRYQDCDTIILDTVSQMSEEYLDFLMENVSYGGKFRDAVKIENDAILELGKVEVPAQADYHIVRNKMRPMIKKLIKADIDVWFLCHVREPSPLDAKKIRRPALTDAVYKVVARECNLLGFCEKNRNDEQATISFEASPLYVAKSRIGLLDKKSFTADNFVTTIQEWKKL